MNKLQLPLSEDVGWIKERSDESTFKVLVDPLRLIHPTAYQEGGTVL